MICTLGAIRHNQLITSTKEIIRTSTMTRPTKSESSEKEERLQQVITVFLNKEKTTSEIIHGFNVARKPFHRRFIDIPPHNRAHEKNQFLSHWHDWFI